jgi:hypothetical protein
MSNIKKTTTCFIFTMLLFTWIYAGDNHNSISVSNRSNSTLKLTGASIPGNEMGVIMEDSQWINYVNESNPTEPLKSISAYIASGDIPPGVEIYAEASHDNGLGHGKTGRPTGKVKLSNVPVILINEIGTCNTGNGKFHGHKVTLYTMVKDYAQMHSGDFNIYIQYILN